MTTVFVSYHNEYLNGIHATAAASLASLACAVQGSGRVEWQAAFDAVRHSVPGLDAVGAGGSELDVNLYLINDMFDGESYRIISYDTTAQPGDSARQYLIASDDMQPIPHLVQAALFDVAMDEDLDPAEAAAKLHDKVAEQIRQLRASFFVRTAIDAVGQLPGHPEAQFGPGLFDSVPSLAEPSAEAYLEALPSMAVAAFEQKVKLAYPDLQFDVSDLTSGPSPRAA